MTGPRLYIAAKPPVPGLVKTRLARKIGSDAATALYAAFLDDIAAMVRGLDVRAGWFVPEQPRWEPPGLGPCQLDTRFQRGVSWAERQAGLFAECGPEPGSPVVLIASDSPQVAGTEIRAAIDALRDYDVVLGPVLDGGYYLVGLRGSHDILGGVEMSTSSAGAEVLARARTLGLTTATLAATFDVDAVSDLALLARAVDTLPHLQTTATVLAGIRVAST